jgi:hypothetical protein
MSTTDISLTDILCQEFFRDRHEFLRVSGHDLEYDSPSFRLVLASDAAPAIRCRLKVGQTDASPAACHRFRVAFSVI